MPIGQSNRCRDMATLRFFTTAAVRHHRSLFSVLDICSTSVSRFANQTRMPDRPCTRRALTLSKACYTTYVACDYAFSPADTMLLPDRIDERYHANQAPADAETQQAMPCGISRQ